MDQTGATTVPARDPHKEQVRRLAQEFEAMLMTQMLREMRRSMLSDDDEADDGLGRDTMTDTIDVELGRALSRVGGFGLSSVMLKAIDRGAGLIGRPRSCRVRPRPDRSLRPGRSRRRLCSRRLTTAARRAASGVCAGRSRGGEGRAEHS